MWDAVRTAVITILILVLVHQIYNHLQSTLTVPRVADLIQRPAKQYAAIEQLIKPEASELSTFLQHLQR